MMLSTSTLAMNVGFTINSFLSRKAGNMVEIFFGVIICLFDCFRSMNSGALGSTIPNASYNFFFLKIKVCFGDCSWLTLVWRRKYLIYQYKRKWDNLERKMFTEFDISVFFWSNSYHVPKEPKLRQLHLINWNVELPFTVFSFLTR